jgi:hydrogenase expression/formation protein HypD
MKYIDDFRDKELAKKLIGLIHASSKHEARFMEVCGGHTTAIQKFGIPGLLPLNIKLISGPGCPVCVSGKLFIDQSIEYSKKTRNIITTLGDLVRVPGSVSSLERAKSEGADIRVVHSPLQALQIAEDNKDRNIIFLGIGFETTAPATAVTIKMAIEKRISNFFLLSTHKVMPPAMMALVNEGVKINGYVCPGHVSVITGSGIYQPVAEKYKLACVISGFEPLDILQSIYMLIKQFENNNPKVEIQYTRAVKPEGNIKARLMMEEVFETRDDWWRGLGIIPKSGLKLKEKYAHYDIEKVEPLHLKFTDENKECICGEILKGLKIPPECKLFGIVCTPASPIGACMVSAEGSCQAYFKFNPESYER